MGVVLAGGASSRFDGAPKGLALLGGRALALRAADVLLQVCERVAIEAPRGVGYDALGLPLLHAPPEHAGKGPLAGIAAGLANAPAGKHVAFAPCDLPLLTRDIYQALVRVARKCAGAYAITPSGAEPLVAVLNADIRGALLAALGRDDIPRTHAVLDAAGVRGVDFADAGCFANVNTPEDLARLEAQVRRA